MSGIEVDPLLLAALETVKFEGRFDHNGNLTIYKLPDGDGGGSYEIAGINDKYHPEEFKRISSLSAEERAKEAARYIKEYTSPLVSKLPEVMQAFTQDLAFNRGMGGAAKFIQKGLNSLGVKVVVDGKIGPKTLEAINKVHPRALLQAISNAQLDYEYELAYNDSSRKKFISGLENRIRNRQAMWGAG
jgi:lysozyme family protein